MSVPASARRSGRGVTGSTARTGRPAAGMSFSGEVAAAYGRVPFQPKLLALHGAVAEIHVDQGLVRDRGVFSQLLEVRERLAVETNRDLLLQPLRVRILPRARKVILPSHRG